MRLFPRPLTSLLASLLILSLTFAAPPSPASPPATPTPPAPKPADTEIPPPTTPGIIQLNVTIKTDDGSIPPDLKVWAQYWSQATGTQKVDVTLGSDGIAVVDIPENLPKNVTLAIRATAAGYGRMALRYNSADGTLPDLPANITIPLHKAAGLSGTVFDQDGKPFAGAGVVIWTSGSGPRPSNPQGVPYVEYGNNDFTPLTTDLSGRWTSAPLAPGSKETISLGVYHVAQGANEYGYYNIEKVEDLAALRDGSYRTTLKRGQTLRVKVLDEAGQPIHAALVGLGSDRVASNVLPEAVSNPQGIAEVGVLPGAETTLTIKFKDKAPEVVTLTPSPNQPELTVTLKPAKTLTGKVLGPDGKPIPNAYVWIESFKGVRTLNTTLRSDANGIFTWPNAPEEAVQADCESPGLARASGLALAPGQPNEIRLLKPAVFHGTVVDADTGKPIEKFEAIQGIDFKNGQPVSFNRQYSNGRSAKVNEPGKFELAFTFPYPGLAVRVEAPGYLPASSPSFAIPDGDQTFTFKLKKAPNISLKLTKPDGSPAANIRVYLVTSGNPLQVTNGEVAEWQKDRYNNTTTADDGSFSFQPQADPFVLFACSPDGYIRTDSAKLSAAPLTLLAWASLEGDVRIGPKPAPNTEVNLDSIFQDPSNKPPTVFFYQRVKTDANGHFSAIRIAADDYNVGRLIHLRPNSWTTAAGKRVTLKPGDHLTITLGGTGVPVVGKILLPPELQGRSNVQLNFGRVSTKLPAQAILMALKAKTDAAQTEAERQKIFADFQQSPEGKNLQAQQREAQAKALYFPFEVKPDGTYRIDDVPPGTYVLDIDALARTTRFDPNSKILATGHLEFTIPPLPEGKTSSETPFEAPTLTLAPPPQSTPAPAPSTQPTTKP